MNRRKFLGGALAGLSLSWAGPLFTARGEEAKPPLRFLSLIDRYGLSGDHSNWVGAQVGDYELTEADLGVVLDPLAPFVGQLAVVSGVTMKSRQVLGGSAAHAFVDRHCLTGSRGSSARSNNVNAHASIDYHIGRFLNDDYGLPFARVYKHLTLGGSFSYDDNGNHIPGLGSASGVYGAAFGTGDKAGLAAQQLVLDRVAEQLRTIRPEMYQANASTALDAYEASVESVTKELVLRKDLVCQQPGNPSNGTDSRVAVEQLFDAMFNMFACDLTSSASYVFPVGIKQGFLYDADVHNDAALSTALKARYHQQSHRQNEIGYKVQELSYRWRSQLLANLLTRLAETPEINGVGTMLDNTVVYLSSSMAKNVHNTVQPYATLIVAGKNANIRTGWHYDCSSHSNNEVLTTLGQAVTSPIDRFGGYKADFTYGGNALNSGPIAKMLKQVYA